MIQIETDYVENIPVLNIAPSDQADEELPTLIFLHGFTSSKEQNLSYAYLLAKEGIRVILPDFPHHGERAIHLSTKERNWKFWDIIVQGITELETVKNHYIEKGHINIERIGVAGTSMGSITMFGALTQYDWIKLSVSMMGTPCYEDFANLMLKSLQNEGVELPISIAELEEKFRSLKIFDLSQNPQLLGNRPLLIWHGEADSVVPYQLTKRFYDKLLYNGYADTDQVHMLTDQVAGHKVTRDACHQAVDWIIEHI
ncbi:alpha/beta fold hydrolase [Pseudalkalibacillus berkeleyi]|uniref:Prolyl oligopeptidase family serine peptidase n=1 Tax=Pseudalkalibacillus berkeleyi TaxID=1069813 RepID=A0ABS9GVG9_9BACL|nr:alpha/beta fold hydrolase [Pseudalkalibacillus berkeleyi]MCF6136812.1 prolyl oligopeptidase family serine peptidase [Pseudalkalibacillus berkeleyi]